jgi:hypothetical protein
VVSLHNFEEALLTMCRYYGAASDCAALVASCKPKEKPQYLNEEIKWRKKALDLYLNYRAEMHLLYRKLVVSFGLSKPSCLSACE